MSSLSSTGISAACSTGLVYLTKRLGLTRGTSDVWEEISHMYIQYMGHAVGQLVEALR
jgi:hypothetical protein